MSKIEDVVEKLIFSTINNLGYELYDVEYEKEGKDYFLRIYIESEKGIDLNDCEKVSNSITELLDKEDPIKEQYFLEVSSTGVEKVLKKDKHLEANIGTEVCVKLFKPLDNNKECKGILKSFNDDSIVIFNKKDIEIERKNISQIKTVYNW